MITYTCNICGKKLNSEFGHVVNLPWGSSGRTYHLCEEHRKVLVEWLEVSNPLKPPKAAQPISVVIKNSDGSEIVLAEVVG